mmetsp:Transcript_44795/g.136737  ORF Transcript_44795/g.136737 Transcript_44795/m.136737 type:complete len:324 (+) Transcript_44795:1103-2074(+)
MRASAVLRSSFSPYTSLISPELSAPQQVSSLPSLFTLGTHSGSLQPIAGHSLPASKAPCRHRACRKWPWMQDAKPSMSSSSDLFFPSLGFSLASLHICLAIFSFPSHIRTTSRRVRCWPLTFTVSSSDTSPFPSGKTKSSNRYQTSKESSWPMLVFAAGFSKGQSLSTTKAQRARPPAAACTTTGSSVAATRSSSPSPKSAPLAEEKHPLSRRGGTSPSPQQKHLSALLDLHTTGGEPRPPPAGLTRSHPWGACGAAPAKTRSCFFFFRLPLSVLPLAGEAAAPALYSYCFDADDPFVMSHRTATLPLRTTWTITPSLPTPPS